MRDNAYKRAMDKIPMSEDFEERTVALLKKRRRARIPRRARYWAAGLAATLALAIAVPTMLNRMGEKTSDAVTPEQEQTIVAKDAAAATSQERMGATGEPLTNLTGDASSMALAPAAMPGYNTEEYAYVRENGFQSALTSPLSTFAADVDTASYANIRRMLLDGEAVPADAVRIEEMINYFGYDYPEPTGDAPFSVTTRIAPCPWNENAKILLVGLQAKKIDESERPNSNLVFLIDVSGSMDSQDKLGLAQQAFLLLTNELREGDTVSIVTYAGTDSVVLEGAGIEDRAEIMSAIESLFAGGSTAGAAGIETAYEIAGKYFVEGGNNRVILATDGDLNVGISSEGELTRLIEEKRETGVYLSVMGFGTGNLKDNKLEALADNGNGNYSYIDSLLEAKKVLVEELGANFFTVAKDVKLQIEFNPARVASYRQIGYENRALADEDFADDEVDGGEIGAGHRVTVLYEIIEATGDEESGLKYQTNGTTGSDEYCTVSVRAKAPDGDASKLYEYPVGEESASSGMTGDMSFAAAVAEVGMLLRDSEYAGTSSYDGALALLEGVPGVRDDPYKDEFLYLVRRLARSNGS